MKKNNLPSTSASENRSPGHPVSNPSCDQFGYRDKFLFFSAKDGRIFLMVSDSIGDKTGNRLRMKRGDHNEYPAIKTAKLHYEPRNIELEFEDFEHSAAIPVKRIYGKNKMTASIIKDHMKTRRLQEFVRSLNERIMQIRHEQDATSVTSPKEHRNQDSSDTHKDDTANLCSYEVFFDRGKRCPEKAYPTGRRRHGLPTSDSCRIYDRDHEIRCKLLETAYHIVQARKELLEETPTRKDTCTCAIYVGVTEAEKRMLPLCNAELQAVPYNVLDVDRKKRQVINNLLHMGPPVVKEFLMMGGQVTRNTEELGADSEIITVLGSHLEVPEGCFDQPFRSAVFAVESLGEAEQCLLGLNDHQCRFHGDENIPTAFMVDDIKQAAAIQESLRSHCLKTGIAIINNSESEGGQQLSESIVGGSVMTLNWIFKSDSSLEQKKVQAYPECRKTAKGKEYIGKMKRTENGNDCLRWDSRPYPTPKDFQPVLSYEEHFLNEDPGSHENYCRNPALRERPWCFISNPDIVWEFCDIPLCEDPGYPKITGENAHAME
ncbi:unnamed protein product [Darwinula stevensoni]|uniref:Kringle domain-containing protein n=1 Tax=Darwinula stevensoni TaxID=69355 RepID=A0A7R9FSC3_9CRUS|nr:unnamed protein product [Darwinula stevensoni]CAG0903221.1 unnamed protein product [Darwinula stevensoni]